jgi:hypothetical protein
MIGTNILSCLLAQEKTRILFPFSYAAARQFWQIQVQFWQLVYRLVAAVSLPRLWVNLLVSSRGILTTLALSAPPNSGLMRTNKMLRVVKFPRNQPQFCCHPNILLTKNPYTTPTLQFSTLQLSASSHHQLYTGIHAGRNHLLPRI